jgi:hypothetical protein
VYSDADRPYSTPFAMSMASRSPLKGMSDAIGPKISSWLVRHDGPSPPTTVGARK